MKVIRREWKYYASKETMAWFLRGGGRGRVEADERNFSNKSEIQRLLVLKS